MLVRFFFPRTDATSRSTVVAMRVSAAIGAILVLFAEASHAAAPVPHPGWPVQIGSPNASSIGGTAVSIVDLWGDGTRRVVVSEGLSGFYSPGDALNVFRKDGTIESQVYPPGIYFQTPLAFVDRNDDGQYEIVSGGNEIAMLDANGNVLWKRPRIDGDPYWGYIVQPYSSVGDLDGDGKLWIVSASEDWAIYVLDLDGNPRPGWIPRISPPPNESASMSSAPMLVDLDGDGKLEIVTGNAGGEVLCLHSDGSVCAGFPYYVPKQTIFPYLPTCFEHTPPLPFRDVSSGQWRIAAIDVCRMKLYVMDANGADVSPYPQQFATTAVLLTLGAYEKNGQGPTLTISAARYQHALDLVTGAYRPGWPASTDLQGARTLAGDFGSASGLACAFSGLGMIPGSGYWDGSAHLDAFDVNGTHISGYPDILANQDFTDPMALDTLDGAETTLCWTADEDSGTASVHCLDLGVPWDRSKVQWGTSEFDLQRTSRFRRLYQIDRSKTCLTVPATEIPSDSGASFDVTVCPRDKNNAPLAPDQEVRFARRPVLGQFVGPVRYDAGTGNYKRTFQPPVQTTAADIEFRVFVNEELDNTMPVVHLRAKPVITSWSPDGAARGGAAVTITLTGTNYSPTPTVVAATAALTVQSYTVTGSGTINVTVIAPAGAAIGWSGLQVVSSAGERSNAAPIFVYDPAQVTLAATKPAGSTSNAKLEWFSGNGALTLWTLERSATPDFAAKTQLYRGTSRTFTDTTAAAPIWYYRVQ